MIDARRLSVIALLTLLAVAFLPGCCGAKCSSGATFAFQTPLAGQQFDIMVTNGDPTRARMTTCEVADTGTSCGYAPPLFVTFDAQGRLDKIDWLDAPNGQLHLTVRVDGTSAVDQTFDYPYAPGSMICGTSCAAPKTFAIQ